MIPRGWEGLTPDETLDLIRQRIDQHHKRLEDFAERVDLEAQNRSAAIHALDQKLPDLKEEFRELVKDAAAGDLGKDAWGVTLFILAEISQIAGSKFWVRPKIDFDCE